MSRPSRAVAGDRSGPSPSPSPSSSPSLPPASSSSSPPALVVSSRAGGGEATDSKQDDEARNDENTRAARARAHQHQLDLDTIAVIEQQAANDARALALLHSQLAQLRSRADADAGGGAGDTGARIGPGALPGATPSLFTAALAAGRPALRPPKEFDGKVMDVCTGNEESVDEWIRYMERYMIETGVPEVSKAKYAMFYLVGPALRWYETITRECLLSAVEVDIGTWPWMKKKLLMQYRPFNRKQIARERLATLRQTSFSSLSAFISAFQDLVGQCDDMSTADQIAYFTRGLKDSLQREIERVVSVPAFGYTPQLHYYMEAATRFDRIDQRYASRMSAMRQAAGWRAHRPQQQQHGVSVHRFRPNQQARTEVNALAAASAGFAGSADVRDHGGAVGDEPGESADDDPSLHALTTGMSRDERMRLMRERRCFICKQQGHQARECKSSMAASFRSAASASSSSFSSSSGKGRAHERV